MTNLKTFFLAATLAAALMPPAGAQSSIAAVGADPSNGNRKAGYRMKLSAFGAWPSFADRGIQAHQAHQFSVSGNWAFVLTQGDIAIFDIRDPASPDHAGGFSPGMQPFVTFASDGKHIYGVTASNDSTDSELEIWDVSDGAHPAKASSLSLGLPHWVTIRAAGSIVFVAPIYGWGNAIKIINVSDPNHPREIAEYRASGDIISSIALSGDKLLVGSGESLEVIDISAPALPKLLGSWSQPGWYTSPIEAAGNTVFVVSHNGGAFYRRLVLDISDPTRPVQLAELPGVFDRLQVAADGGFYAYSGGETLQIFDLSNPASPRMVGQITNTVGYGYIDVADGKVYAAGFSLNPNELGYDFGLNIFDASIPSAPRWLGGATWPNPAPSPIMPGYHHHSAVALSRSYAYVFDHHDGWVPSTLLVFDVGDPAQPRLAASLPVEPRGGTMGVPRYVRDVEISGNVLCYGDQYSLSLMDITDPKSPKASAELDFGGSIAMEGSLLFVASSSHFRVVDVTNPYSPTVRGELPFDDLYGDVKIAGTCAFVASAGGLRIVDISNPSAPQLKATYNPPLEANRLTPPFAVSGDYLYGSSWHAREDPVTGASGYTAIHVLDVSDPAQPVVVAIQPLSSRGSMRRMRVAGNRLYIHRHESNMPGEWDFLHVFDIGSPREIFQVAEFGNRVISYPDYPRGQFSDFAANEHFVFFVGRAFEVERAEFIPFLGVSRKDGKMELNWPNVDLAFQLRQASRLDSSAEWLNSSLAPVTIEGQNYLSLPMEGGANFFRLQKP